VPIILAAQSAGGSIGSVMSPGKVIVGCSTVGLTGREGEAMRWIMLLGLIPILVIAILATILALV
jgi:lactate permease